MNLGSQIPKFSLNNLKTVIFKFRISVPLPKLIKEKRDRNKFFVNYAITISFNFFGSKMYF